MPRRDEAKRDRQVTRFIHRLFWDAAWHNRTNLILAWILFPIAFLLTAVFVPLQIAYGVQAIIEKDFSAVTTHSLYVALASIGYVLFVSLATLAYDKHAVVGGSYLQKKIFQNFLQKDYEFFSDNFVGSLGSQAIALRDAFLSYDRIFLFEIPRMITIFAGGIAVIAFSSTPLAFITLACVIAIATLTLLGSNYRLKYRRALGKANSKLSGMIGDTLSHGSTVKGFGSESYELHRIGEPLHTWGMAQRKSWDSFLGPNAVRNLLTTAAIIVLLLVTANLYIDQKISVAIVVLVQLYMIRLVTATIEIMEIFKMYDTSMGLAGQPVSTMLREPYVKDLPHTRAMPKIKQVTFHKISHRYNGMHRSARSVANFSLDISRGERIGLVGYSGSGKTTLTKLLMRFMDVDKGSILINGVNIREFAQSELRTNIAYVPQEPLLFHRSIYENIAYGRPNATRAEVMEAARLAYVDEFVDELPNKYKTLVGERGVKLSGGQRQRVAIARAILKDASVLVLDEATSALDSRSEKFIQDALANLMKDRTALVIAHRLSTIQRMDRIVVMDKGTIVQTGTHDKLKAEPGIYGDLWAHQSGGYIGIPAN